MNKHQAMVLEFHKAFLSTIGSAPAFPDAKDVALRKNLINEEAAEFCKASDDGDVVGIADALADLLYVVYGAAITYGIDIEPVFAEVHRSNMSKLWDGPNGPEVRKRPEDGKVLKPSTYSPADIKKTLCGFGL